MENEAPSESSHQAAPERADRGQTASQISREIVRLHARLYGRGPTKARTYLQPDYALCILEEVFTTAERTLISAGNAAQVQENRAAFQEAVSDQFVELVKEATGREVRAFVSQVHIGEEMVVAFFLFGGPPPLHSADAGS